MSGPRLNEWTAMETAQRSAQGETTARAVVEACLEQVARREPEVLAFEHLDAAGARGNAASLPLAGACFGIKDIIDTAESRCRARPAASRWARRSPPNSPTSIPARPVIPRTRRARPAVPPPAPRRQWRP